MPITTTVVNEGRQTKSVSRTIKCDAPECKNEITFDPQNQEAVAALPAWIRTLRTISLGNGTEYVYCSDPCEVNGATTGNHNVPEPKRVEAGSEAAIRAAIHNAEAAKAMRAEQPQA